MTASTTLAQVPPRVAFAAYAAVVALTAGLLGYWVYRDARARGSANPRFWGLAAVVVGLVLFSYLYNRWRWLDDERAEWTHLDRVVETALVALGTAVVGSAVLAPPDPYSLPLYAGGALLVTAPLAYLLVYRDARSRPGVRR